ncbi:hypothetical protein [Gordonia otitidis]|uniref:hypothetical protein n=1 Tax=Gordonia otitidis TaxID=249058 RepID=UPI0002FEF35E|nr:hypothetical protein [Gordonia otitidis]
MTARDELQQRVEGLGLWDIDAGEVTIPVDLARRVLAEADAVVAQRDQAQYDRAALIDAEQGHIRGRDAALAILTEVREKARDWQAALCFGSLSGEPIPDLVTRSFGDQLTAILDRSTP